MTKKLRQILEQMENSCDSQQLAVADCLSTIAENGDEQAADFFLVACAGEIRDAAQSVIDQMSKRKCTSSKTLSKAAPDLLGVVERVYDYEVERMSKGDHHFHDEEIEEWGKLIAKAKGGTP